MNERLIESQPRGGEKIPVDVDTHVNALLAFENGVQGSLMTSFDVWDSQTPRLEIYGEQGTLCIADPDPTDGINIFGGQVLLQNPRNGKVGLSPSCTKSPEHWHVAENTHNFNEDTRGIGLVDLAYAVKNQRPARASGKMAQHVCEIMFGILESSKTGQFSEIESRCDIPAPLPVDFLGVSNEMSVTTLDFSEPFFTVKYVTDEKNIPINEKTIVLNLSEQPLRIESQTLSKFQSVIALNTVIPNMEKGVLVERFASYDDEAALLDAVRKLWPLAYEIRREERLKGVGHYMSPKSAIGNIQFSMYFRLFRAA
ncbi:hypothetical protein P4S70_22240 [Enterovibrio sp. Hal110]